MADALPWIERKRTPATADELRTALAAGHHIAFGTVVAERRVAVAWAQCAFEHGLHAATARMRRNQAGMLKEVAALLRANPPADGDDSPMWYVRGIWGNNVGNIDGTAEGAIGLFETVPEREIIAGHEQHQHHVRAAFATLTDGATAYWKRLARRWPRALAVLAEGSVPFVHELKAARYFTGNEGEYVAGVSHCLRVYDQLYSCLPPASEGWP